MVPLEWFSIANGFSCRLLRTFLLRLPKKWLFSAASVKYRGDALSSELNLQERMMPSADMCAIYAPNMIAAQWQKDRKMSRHPKKVGEEMVSLSNALFAHSLSTKHRTSCAEFH